MIKEYSVKIGEYLACELSLDQRNKNITVFGLEVIIGAIVKSCVFLVIAFSLGVFYEALAVTIVKSSLRWVAGGPHCSSFFNCTIVSSSLIFGFTWIGFLLADIILLKQSMIAVFLFALAVNLLYAPSDPPQKPINNPGKKILLKLVVCAQLAGYMLIVNLNILPSDIACCILMGILLESLTLFPPGAGLIQRLDQLMTRSSERRCAA
ncbi:accessory gene regulator B [Desulfocucumis palustris]|uniref:Accessory gene regulator B n=1 Tax=Desulfocucumis palustris TaxID=1898651 RepID=A0A2L2XDN2_9FIRM|nr:accessory gene regulator B family protein [Desulfocucumis palustris]GBF34325.1 accessory gene regulator B [Desulfocucumis palustris]